MPTAPASNPYVKKLDYNYDDDGNRTSVVTTLWGLAPTSSAYTTNNLNQYTVVAGTNRTHDSNGNLTNDGISKFVYNYKNLIVEARLASTNVLYASYKYDAEGRRVEKNVVAGAGKFERYIRSRGPRKEGSCGPCLSKPERGGRYKVSQVVATFDSNGAWKQNFVWGERIDEIAALEQADVLDYDGDSNTAEITRSYYQLNALGSVMEITDANQAKVVSYRYTPYGEMTITRGGVTQAADPLGQYWGYTGRFSDEETELWYYRARYYDAASGRFVSRDPIGYEEGPGLFEYSISSPASYRDPSGMGLWAEGRNAQRATGEFFAPAVVHALAMSAKSTTRQMYGDHSDGTRGNAFQHCLWSCLLAKRFGATVAENITTFHETGGRADAKNKDYDQHSDMDLYNNKQGIECADAACCICCCLNAYWLVIDDPGYEFGEGPEGPGTPGGGVYPESPSDPGRSSGRGYRGSASGDRSGSGGRGPSDPYDGGGRDRPGTNGLGGNKDIKHPHK